MAAAYHRQWQLRGAGRILERLLNQQALDQPTLDRLLVKFAQAEQSTASTLANGLIGERCLVIHDHGSPTVTSTWFGVPTMTAAQKAWADAVAYCSTITGLKDRQLLQLLQGYDDVIRRAEALGTAEALAGFPAAAEGRVPPAYAAGGFYASTLIEQQELIAWLRGVQLALTIESFRSTHQHLPQSLFDLTPSLMPQLLHDPFTNAPFHYRVNEKKAAPELKTVTSGEQGYIVYSVGKDGVDDGGTPPRSSESNAKGGYDVTFQIDR